MRKGDIEKKIVRQIQKMSDDCGFWALCLVIVLPFCRCHARLFFEVAGHGLIVGKARFDGDGGYFHLGTFEQQAFGMLTRYSLTNCVSEQPLTAFTQSET